ncbi:hypothetical protein GS575_11585 [Rhodococcus hoagii]|nr:hypothetical protein [Prescottella equi]
MDRESASPAPETVAILARRKRSDLSVRHLSRRSAEHPDDLDHRDPTTPYQGGASLADTLGGSLLTVEGEQHTIAMSGTNECVNTIVTAYLTDLRTPEQGSSCTLG